MKKISIISIVLLLSSFVIVKSNDNENKVYNSAKLNNLKEEMLIKESVKNYYVEGLRIRNFNLIKHVCIPETKLMNAGDNGEFYITTLDSWSKKFDPLKPPFKKLESCVLKIDRVGTAAQVKLLLIVDSSTRIVDFLHMLKINGEWKITHIIDY